ncbi:hypothetical protein Tco_0478373, partial [Tanacetum coccineum]
MSNMSEDIQYAGSDTRPPMLDRTDFESWQQRIRLYCLGKDNGENIMKSITEGPFQMGTMRDTLTEGGEGALHLGPVRARVFADLSAEQKDRYKADIRATNIILQGIPKDIYSLINHYTDAKDIWDNVKMILEGSELTKDDRESQLYDEFEHFCQIKGETIHVYYVRFTKLINDMRNIKMTMPRMQLNSKFVNNMLPEWSRFITEVKLNRGLKESNFDQLYAYLKQHEDVRGRYNVNNQGRYLDDLVDTMWIKCTLVDHVFEADQCDAFDSDVNEGPTTQTMFMANLISEEAGASYDSNRVGGQNRDSDYFKDKMMLMHAHENGAVLDEEQLLFLAGEQVTNFDDDVDDLALNVDHVFEADQCDAFRPDFYEVMSNHARAVVHDSEDTRDIAEITRKRMMEKMKSPLCVENKENVPFKDVRVELEKVKQHYKELYDSIKITRAHTSEKTSTMLNEIESLKAQLRSKESCFTSDYVKPKVLAPGMYAIDVKPIPHPLKNNRSAHLNYISHLKESVETVREIVEEARVVKPLDNALNYACQYTKLSQELLEYVIGTCPKSFNERDNKAPSTPVTRKKQVTFSDKPGTSSSNTQKHEVHQKVQQTNVHVIHSTGVNTSTEASGSKPRSNTKKNRILPAKSENKKKVEDHPRTNKSVWTKVNRVDSSISSKRVVINSNSESMCKTCNKCLNSASHEMCVVNILNSVNATPTVKIVLNKEKQIWKPKGKLSDNSLNKTKQIWKPKGKLSDYSLNKTKQVWKATGKLFANVGYQWRSTGKKVALGKLNCDSQWRPTGKKFALGELCPLTKLSVQCSIIT